MKDWWVRCERHAAGKGAESVARHVCETLCAHACSPRRAYAAGLEARSRAVAQTTAARQGRGPRSWSAKAAERRLRQGGAQCGEHRVALQAN